MQECQTIYGVAEQLNLNQEINEINTYKITENFQKHGQNTYTLVNLIGETEDGEIYFSDAEEMLEYEISSFLSKGFLLKSILNIKTNDKTTIINLNDGSITIELL